MIRLLLIDDSPDDTLLAIDELRRGGLLFEARTAATLDEAATALDNGPWSVVISDYNLGAHTGLDTLRLVRSRDADVPFLLLSGTIGEERAAEVILEGASDYVMKDRMTRLAAAVRRAIDAADARQTKLRLQTQLRLAEERYRTTFERAPVGIGNLGPDGCFLHVNERFRAIVGYEEHELLGQPLTKLIHPDDVAMVRATYQRHAEGAAPSQYERRYIHKDGHMVWVMVTVSAVHTANGELQYLIGLVEDISEHKAAREKLLLQSRLLESVEQAVVATDIEGRITYWNAFAEKLYGWSAEEVHGKPITEVMPAAGGEGQDAAIVAEVARGASWSGEVQKVRRDGSTFTAWVNVAPLLDEHDRLIGAAGVSHDLTPLKQAEDELRANEMQLAAAQEMARAGSWTYDYITKERKWSDSFIRIYGFPAGTAPSANALFERIHPADRERVRETYERARASAEPLSDQFRIITGEGERVLSMKFQTLRDASGAVVKGFGVVQDITTAKQLEEDLRHRSAQQSTVANLGQLALSGASIPFLLEQAVQWISTTLQLDDVGVLQNTASGQQRVAGTQWDHTSGTRPRHAVAVPIRTGDGSEWGVLVGSTQAAQPTNPADIDFLRSIATVIGQALDRVTADTALRTRARQQSVIAHLGRLLLASLDEDVYTMICDLVHATLNADHAMFAELADDGHLRTRAGTGWTGASAEPMPIHPKTQSGAAIMTGEPVVVDDYRNDERFDKARLAIPKNVLSGVVVPIASSVRTFGVLSVHSKKAQHFREEDIDFLQSVANLLAEAMEREVARHAVETSENRYRRIFSGATEIIYTLDADGRFITLNPAFEAITGLKADEWIGQPYAALVVPEDRERVTAEFAQMLSMRKTAQLETTIVGRDRHVILEIMSFPQVVDGEVVEIYGFGRDVTEARRAAVERERFARSLELLLESTVEGIYTIDMEGRCTMVNRSAATFLGLEPAELIGVSVHEMLHATKPDGTPNPIETCPVHGVLRHGDPVTISNDVFCRKDGTPIPVSYSVAPIIDMGERVGAVVTFIDQTERRKLEARLEQANRLTSLGRLAATVAHEFNNVLMGIAPFVEVLRRSPPRERVESSLDHIASSVRRGRRITEDILRFTQPAEPARVSVELRPWLAAIAREARSLLGDGYTVTVEAQPLWVEADPNQLHQIVTNLLLNARDAMPQGGHVMIEVRRETADARFPFGAVEDPSRFAHFIVRDTGTGMAEETLQHVFEPLYTTKKSGTGLGLAVTHQVVQRHGGAIFVESSVGKGTAFHIFLPLTHPAFTFVTELGGVQTQLPLAREVLLVEDDPTVAAGIRGILEGEGFTVTVADTGRDALAQVAERVPDVVVLDVGLPDLDGTAVYAQLAAKQPSLPVVFSTGHADRGGLEHLLVKDNVGFLLKPYDTRALLRALGEVLAPH